MYFYQIIFCIANYIKFTYELAKKYNYLPERCILNPIIGEYDDPANQRQGLLTLNLSDKGNTIVYGASGSGKSTFLSSIIYSTITNHKTDEVNFYILDFGSEIFRVYKKAPQVGDVIMASDTEKINNVFKMITDTMNKRKKILSEYYGSFNYYNKKSDNKMPLMVIMINNYEAFYENYMQYEEKLISITREGPMYGIVFILSVSATNGIRYKLRQNFSNEYVLQLNDESDYSMIFGGLSSIRKKLPSKMYGRGLVKLEDVFEFQTATAYNPEKFSEYISELCSKLKDESTVFAEPIAVLPEIVTTDDVNSRLQGLKAIPLGIDKNKLSISTWDFESNLSTIISASNIDDMKFFIEPFINQFKEVKKSTVIVLDAENILSGITNDNIYYYKKDFDKIILSLYDNKEIFNNVKPVVCIIVGLNSMLMKLGIEAKNKYDELIRVDNIVQTVKFIFVDSIDLLKKLEYDIWYKDIVKSNQGIWIGNGIAEQYTIKLSKVSRELQQEVEKGFGYVIKRGVPYLTKFLTSDSGYGDDYE